MIGSTEPRAESSEPIAGDDAGGEEALASPPSPPPTPPLLATAASSAFMAIAQVMVAMHGGVCGKVRPSLVPPNHQINFGLVLGTGDFQAHTNFPPTWYTNRITIVDSDCGPPIAVINEDAGENSISHHSCRSGGEHCAAERDDMVEGRGGRRRRGCLEGVRSDVRISL